MAIKVEGKTAKGPKGETKTAPPGQVFVMKDGVRLLRPADNPTPELSRAPVTGGQSTGNPQLDEMARAMEGGLQNMIRGGNVLNTNIEITADKVREFTDQASREIDPYYTSQYSSMRKEFEVVTNEILEQEKATEKETVEGFGRSLRGKRDEIAERGFAMSGVRKREEGELATDFQGRLDATRRGVVSAVRGNALTLERNLGTRNLKDLSIPTFSSAQILGSFQPGETSLGAGVGRTAATPLFSLSTDVTGRLEEEQERAKRLRIEQLKSAFRESEARRLYAGA